MTLKQHLEEAIEFHEQILDYMIKKEYYNPHDTDKQLQIDLKTAKTALTLSKD
ncbi:spore coat protein [Alkalihalobacillus deserti]|uniref:spore coat protein n=1 Tax=Alkalihalobacillus deserti TaxID=2879466 RepID=UPI001D139EFA|nr:spore coat protein [Alkalihalobacillus deserti]